MNPDSFDRIFNLAEVGLWIGIGLAFIVAFAVNRRGLALFSALLFVAFGITDLVEMRTGAWWRPVSLLVVKVAIVAGLLACFITHCRQTKRK